MDRTERFYRIDQLLQERRVVPMRVLLEELGVSRATVKRDLEYLRDRLHAPIVWDRAGNGYRFEAPAGPGHRYALPGLWLNAGEIHALLVMEQLLSEVQPGLLGGHIAPLLARVRVLLDSTDHSPEEVRSRIRVLRASGRRLAPRHFELISGALLRRRRLRIRHYSRARDTESEREISPQRLVHYRDNWYLDAWCHLRRALRSFAVDGIREARALDAPARELTTGELDEALAGGYGIFTGPPRHTARLRFNAEHARWVADEQWHPDQRGRFDAQGHYVLEVPYSDDRELVMDIMKHGDGVEVLAPAALRRRVTGLLAAAVGKYR